ncbi:MAG: LapA family protein [Candidatus Riflebacteria bacterium]|nr:LapA family protein [Candidatus Riflebacteria bacterium]
MYLKLVVVLLMALLLIVLAVQNPNSAQLYFLKWESEPVPMIVIIIVSFLAGVILMVIFNLIRYARFWRSIRDLDNKIHELKKSDDSDKILMLPHDDDF